MALVLVSLAGAVYLTSATSRAAAQEPPSPRVVAGFVDLKQRLHPTPPPTGMGVIVGHVEGSDKGSYMPHQGQQRFAGVQFDPQSGPSQISSHSHATAKVLYGQVGLAPGVRRVLCYDSADWLTKGFLHVGQAQPPGEAQCHVYTHSWIAEHNEQIVNSTLQRVDHVVDSQGVVMVAAVDNGPKSDVPSLIASAYNVITVGRADGRSSGGFTRVSTPGRCKPDIVAPGSLTSFATPVVTAAVARLLEVAHSEPNIPTMRRPETIKAVLLAGAEKPENWHHRPDRPLDEHLGAGIVRVDESFEILRRGPVPTGPIDPDHTRRGWSFEEIESRDTTSYHLDLPYHLNELSIAITWHRKIETKMLQDQRSNKRIWATRPSMADINLTLLNSEGAVVAESISKIDNVELIQLTNLEPGRYELQLSREDTLDTPWPVALAWRGR